MTRSIHLPIAAGLLAFAGHAAAQPVASARPAVDGAKLYQAKCASCHSVDANKIGPAHRGVFGRASGTAPGYSYSAALAKAKIVWNDATLDQWLSGPQKMVKGSKMFLVVNRPEERAAIIAFLKAQTRK